MHTAKPHDEAHAHADGHSASDQSPTADAAVRLFAGPGEMRARCRASDWGATPLGPVETWPQSLRTVAGLVLASGFASLVLWGPELVQLYNDAYVPFLGVKHPRALGAPTYACWPEVRHLTQPVFAAVLRGETVTQREQRYPLRRRGPDQPADDVYVTLSFVPVRDEAGGATGAPRANARDYLPAEQRGHVGVVPRGELPLPR